MVDANELLVWRTRLPETDIAALPPHNLRSNPTVAGDRVLVSAFSRGAVHCLALADGRPLWRFPLDGFGSSSVLVTEEVIYAATPRTLYAIRLEDGGLLWQFTPHPGNGEHVYSAPVVSGDRLFFGDRKGSIFCLDSRTGKSLWTAAVSKSNVNSTVLVVNDRVIAGTNEASAVAVDAMTGRLLWRTEIDGPSIHQVLAHGGAAVIQTESLWWLDPADGAVLGRWTRPQESAESAVTAGDLLVVLLRQEVLVGFKGHDEVYRQGNQGFFGGILSYSPETGCIYDARHGAFYLVDPATGVRLCELGYGDDGFAVAHPAIANGHLYVLGGIGGEVIALRHPDAMTDRKTTPPAAV